jgi:hypothetical protein
MLILRDGSRLQVGESAADTAVKLKNWQTGDDAVERGEHGDRITRSYDDGIRRFLLVIESDQGVEPRVAAIYLPGHAAGPR